MARRKHVKKKKTKVGKYFILLIFILLISLLLVSSNNKFTEPIKVLSPENRTYTDGHIFISVHSNSELKSLERQIDSQSKILECGLCSSFERNDTYFLKGTHSYLVYATFMDDTQFVKEVIFTVK